MTDPHELRMAMGARSAEMMDVFDDEVVAAIEALAEPAQHLLQLLELHGVDFQQRLMLLLGLAVGCASE